MRTILLVVSIAALGIALWSAQREVHTLRAEKSEWIADANFAKAEVIAVDFASRLVHGDFKGAHEMLTPDLRNQITPQKLEQKTISLAASNGQLSRVYAPAGCYDADLKSNEWGYVYVPIEGGEFGHEAVTVMVVDTRKISEIVWGRAD